MIWYQKSFCQRLTSISLSGTAGVGISGGDSDSGYGSRRCPSPCAEAFRIIGLPSVPRLNKAYRLAEIAQQLESCRRGAAALEHFGHTVAYREFRGGHDPNCWRDDLALALPWEMAV